MRLSFAATPQSLRQGVFKDLERQKKKKMEEHADLDLSKGKPS
jgi:hypothetical protein